MKKDKTFYGFVFSIVSLLILLGISIYLGISGWFYMISKTDNDIDLTLGQEVSVSVEANKATALSFGLKGEYVPNEKLSQKIKVNADNLNEDVYIRVKGSVFSSQSKILDIKFELNENWIEDEDGYYYYNDILRGGNHVTFSSSLIFPNSTIIKNDKKYLATVIFETLNTNLDVEEIWGKNINLV